MLISLTQFARFAAALVFVLGLMGALALVMRRINQKHPLTLPRQRRLKIIESLPLDSRRRAVILRRDNREHLVILGADSETVIETGIEAVQDETNVESKN
jgi:flagellar protein FliO/FliZ